VDVANLMTAIWLEALYTKFVMERGTHVHRPTWWKVCRQQLLELHPRN
jgi:hypothetical protein